MEGGSRIGRLSVQLHRVEGDLVRYEGLSIGIALDDGSKEIRTCELRRDRLKELALSILSKWEKKSFGIALSESFNLPVHSTFSKLMLKCYKKSSSIGGVAIPLEVLPQKSSFKKWYQVISRTGEIDVAGQILVELRYELDIKVVDECRQMMSPDSSRPSMSLGIDTASDPRELDLIEAGGLKVYPAGEIKSTVRMAVDKYSGPIIEHVLIVGHVPSDSPLVPGQKLTVDVLRNLVCEGASAFPAGMASFCFPEGVFVTAEDSSDPERFDFILNNGESRIFVSSLRFFEEVLECKVFVPKALCILSSQPCFDLMHVSLASHVSRIRGARSAVEEDEVLRSLCFASQASTADFPLRMIPFALPLSNFRACELIRLVDISIVVKVLAALLTERSIVIRSSNLQLLTQFSEFLLSICFPLKVPKSYIYIPVLPDHMQEYLYAPVPYLIGMLDTTTTFSPPSDAVVLNISSGTLSSMLPVTHFPDQLLAPYVKRIRFLVFPELSGDHGHGEVRDVEEAIRIEFLQLIAEILGNYRQYVFFGPDNVPLFVEESFLETRGFLRPFLSKFVRSHIFKEFVEQHIDFPSLLYDCLTFNLACRDGIISRDVQLSSASSQKNHLRISQLIKHEIEMQKKDHPPSVVQVCFDLLSCHPVQLEAIMSVGELLSIGHWRKLLVSTCVDNIGSKARKNLDNDSFRSLGFLFKVALNDCFQNSEFVTARGILELGRKIWCRNLGFGSQLCLLDLVKSSKVWRHQQFWVQFFQAELERHSSSIETDASDVRLSDACHILSSIICTLRELSVPRETALEIVTILGLSEHLQESNWQDMTRLFSSLFNTKFARAVTLDGGGRRLEKSHSSPFQ